MNAQLQSSELNINKRPNSTSEKPRTSFFIPTPSIEDEGLSARELNQHTEESPDNYVQQQAQERFQARMQRLHKGLLHKNEAAELTEDLNRSELRNSRLEKQLKEYSETLKVKCVLLWLPKRKWRKKGSN